MQTVSAVVPFHNDGATIARTLDSLAAQTLSPLEVVVVDDASSPDQAQALDALAEGWPADRPPLRVLHLATNAGPAGARNEGWAAASGDWIAFCDADDVWHPERLRLQVDAAGDAALVACLRAGTPAAMEAPAPGAAPRVVPVTRLEVLAWNPVKTSAVLIRRDVDERFTAGRRYTEDYELWLRVVLGGRAARLVRHHLIAPQVPDAEASGLTSHRWAMTRGEWETFALVHRDGLAGHVEYAAALGLSGLRAARRHGLVALAALRRRAGR